VKVSGPLCQALPTGDDPGAPATIVGEPPDVVLTWIPVITTFEAAVRAAKLEPRLREMDGVTILAPTDEAFEAAFEEQQIDDLLLKRHDELRELLEAHIVAGTHTLADLRDAGEVTTLAGETLKVSPAKAMARFEDEAKTVCADYAAVNARIHVIDGVLPNSLRVGRPPSPRQPEHLGEAE
jgi:uncharacterized surface protein with fasciclin (FAS1) repeats